MSSTPRSTRRSEERGRTTEPPDGVFDDGFGALLHKQSGAWVVKDVAVGPTDVAWTGWDAQYGAPADLFR
jgi:hypothetical protein